MVKKIGSVPINEIKDIIRLVIRTLILVSFFFGFTIAVLLCNLGLL